MEDPELTESLPIPEPVITESPIPEVDLQLEIPPGVSDDDDGEQIFFKSKKRVLNLRDDSDTDSSDITRDQNNSESPKQILSSKRLSGESSESDPAESSESVYQKSSRIKNRRDKLLDKFKDCFVKNNEKIISKNSNALENIESTDTVISSKISDLYDSESSEEEQADINLHDPENDTVNKYTPEDSNTIKSKMPQRMSAKQAMEQMHKIKSESSRMLREKRFHLPYHRPKRVSLKEILNKKKIEFIPGTKKLNLRMTDEQLVEYAKQLEEKEKDMIQLYKNDSDEESETIVEEKPVEINVLENNSEIMSTGSIASLTTVDNIDTSNQIISTISNTKNPDEEDSVLNSLIQETNDFINNYDKDSSENTPLDILDISNKKMLAQIDVSLNSQPMVHNNISEIFSSSLPAKPKISGAPGSLIDLTPEIKIELTGVDILKKKYLFHSSIKTPEELERDQEHRIMPGTAFMNLRRELEVQISQKRLEEWKKKKEVELLRKTENNELEDELSECEKLLEEKVIDQNPTELNESNAEDEGDDEDEDDEEYIKSKNKKPKLKCDFIDEEAELEDEDPCPDESDNDDDNDDSENIETSDDDKDNELKPIENKKKLTRIYKAFSESSDDENTCQNKNDSTNKFKNVNESFTAILSTPTKDTSNFLRKESDIFGSQDTKCNESFSIDSDDYLPLGQKLSGKPSKTDATSDRSFENTPDFNGQSDGLVSPLIKLGSTSSELNESLNTENKNPQSEQWNDLSNKIFNVQDSIDVITQDTEEIVELCSGKFPSQSTDNPVIDKSVIPYGFDTEMSQNTESQLFELCTGKFPEVTTDSQNIPSTNGILSDSIDHTDIRTSSDELSLKSHENNIFNIDHNSVKKDYVAPKISKKPDIKSFFKPKPIAIINTPLSEVTTEIEPRIEDPSTPIKEKYIMSSSDKESDSNSITKSKVRLSKKDRNKKMKVKPLQISDDESSEEEDEDLQIENDVDHHSDASCPDDEKEIEYDSEENEIECSNKNVELKLPKNKKSSEFFDNEAELTSEDEWKGSGDEDERGLDELEWEDGDADDIDQRKVLKELDRIHRHQMLDQDKREIKILQDILLEDGDLEGGTRERKFKWRNLDDGVESGAVVDGDDNPEEDDIQSEEQWRRQRHERETYLREMMEKKNTENPDLSTESISRINMRMSLIKGKMNLNSKSNSTTPKLHNDTGLISKKNRLSNNDENGQNLTKKDLPSPVKTPLSLIQPGFKGSFLSRSQAALARLALLSKNGPSTKEEEKNRNLNGQRGNFVFTTISPPCNNEIMDEDTKKTKRKASLPSTPILIKKIKLSEDCPKFRKSLFDHIE